MNVLWPVYVGGKCNGRICPEYPPHECMVTVALLPTFSVYDFDPDESVPFERQMYRKIIFRCQDDSADVLIWGAVEISEYEIVSRVWRKMIEGGIEHARSVACVSA